MQFVFALLFFATICFAEQTVDATTASSLIDDPDMVSTDDEDAALHLLVERTRTVLDGMRTRQYRLRRARQEARQDARHQRLRRRIQLVLLFITLQIVIIALRVFS